MKAFSYLPHTLEDRRRMLQELGLSQVEELFSDIPSAVRYQGDLNIPAGLSEWELMRQMKGLARKNVPVGEGISFLGAGAYEHFIPAVVEAITGRAEFYTSYTPYQAEISQGNLQAIFEFQTMICELTGMDVANASMYDGPTALAEAGLMACAATRRAKLLVSRGVHPEARAVLRTYAWGQSIPVEEVPLDNGVTAQKALERQLDDEVAGILVQYPNFLGSIEDIAALSALAHARRALLVVAVNPIALGILEAPGRLGADIVVGDGQPLGNSLSYGGPYLGFLAAKAAYLRRMPGRIVGQTKDLDGRRAFVLTLQAREQHIRREKATSNICSNQALNAIAATVYMACLGKQGFREVSRLNLHKAHYAQKRLTAIPGVEPLCTAPFFNEFAVKLPLPPQTVGQKLLAEGIIGGYDLGRDYPEYEGAMLFAVTEVRSKEEIDFLAERLEAMV